MALCQPVFAARPPHAQWRCPVGMHSKHGQYPDLVRLALALSGSTVVGPPGNTSRSAVAKRQLGGLVPRLPV